MAVSSLVRRRLPERENAAVMELGAATGGEADPAGTTILTYRIEV